MKRRKINVSRNLLFATLFAVTLISGINAAHAALSISCTVTGGSSSSIVYDPSVDAFLHGNNLTVTGVTGTDTQQNAGITLPISNGALNFQTGAFTGKTGNVWNFGSGGTIAMTGGISAPLNLPANTTLLTGSFISAGVTELSLGSYQFDIVGATFGGSDNSNIYQYFGVPANSTCSNALNLSFIGAANTGGGFTSINNFGGIMVDTLIPTPIPAAAWLLGSGLLGHYRHQEKKESKKSVLKE